MRERAIGLVVSVGGHDGRLRHAHLLPVGVLDGWVVPAQEVGLVLGLGFGVGVGVGVGVLIDEVVLDELDRQGRLADAASTYDDQLVLSHRKRTPTSWAECFGVKAWCAAWYSNDVVQ